MPRQYLPVRRIHEIYAELLASRPEVPATVSEVAIQLAAEGYEHPRTRKPPTRAAVWAILRSTKPGRKLLAESERRREQRFKLLD